MRDTSLLDLRRPPPETGCAHQRRDPSSRESVVRRGGGFSLALGGKDNSPLSNGRARRETTLSASSRWWPRSQNRVERQGPPWWLTMDCAQLGDLTRMLRARQFRKALPLAPARARRGRNFLEVVESASVS